MSGSIKVGGHTVFVHTGASGAGTLSVQGQNGNVLLSDDGTAVSLGNNVRLPASGGIKDSSGNNILTESGGNVSIGDIRLHTNSAVRDSSGNAIITDVAGSAVVAPSAGGIPPGAIMAFAMSSAPSGWLVCNGGAVSQSDYSALYSAITNTWISTWVAGEAIIAGEYRVTIADGSIYVATTTGTTSGSDLTNDSGVSWTSSTNFLLPDLRGEFLRGWDNGKGSDPNASTRRGGDNVGSYQKYAIKQHGHTANIYAGNGALAGMNNSPAYHQQGNTHFNLYNTGVSTTTFSITSENLADEIRPRNMAVNYCIKY